MAASSIRLSACADRRLFQVSSRLLPLLVGAILLPISALAEPVLSPPPPGRPSFVVGVTRPTGPHDRARPPIRATAESSKPQGTSVVGQRQAADGASRGEKPADPFHWTDWIQAVSNVCLLVANGALLVVTNRSAKAAQKAAEAALRQAEIMGAAEAPVVRVSNVRIGGQGLTGRDGRPHIPDGPTLILHLVNPGRSPASVVAFGFYKVVQRDVPMEVREAEPTAVQFDIFILPQDSFELMQPFDLSGGERQRMMQAVEHLWIWGFVAFEDGLGTVRRRRFFVQALIDANQEKTLFRFVNLKPPRLIA